MADNPLPKLRRYLKLYQGPDDSQGYPTFNILDPVSSQYYKIEWEQSIIFQSYQQGMTARELQEVINKGSTIKVSLQDIEEFFKELEGYNLIDVPKSSDFLLEERDKRKIGFWKWLLQNYLYIRLPIFNPSSFLKATLPYVMPLVSKPALIFYALCSLTGVFFLIFNFQDYLSTFSYFFNFEGFLFYVSALISVKIIHELAHAYTATRYGVHVPNMGVVFIVFWPALYTNVTDSWKLSNRYQRLAISLAGVIAETVIAGLSTLGWALTEPGVWHSIFFVLSSSTWFTTLAINLNPALRFDGYYILTDLWGIDNLQTRSFSMARWKLRKLLLGLNVPPPEDFNERTTNLMVIYSIYTWIYRLILYTSIAIFVYFKFTKALGIFLFFLEIIIFIAWPIASEISEVKKLRSYLYINRRMVATLTIATLLFGWWALPLPRTEAFHAITVPVAEQIVYAPHDSVITKIEIKRGEEVKKGQSLAKLFAKKIEARTALQKNESESLRKQIQVLGFKDQDRPFLLEKKKELDSSEEAVRGYVHQQNELELKAKQNGKAYEWNDHLYPGQFVTQNDVLGKIADVNKFKVVFFASEIEVRDLFIGQKGQFAIKYPSLILPGQISKITPVRSEFLKYPSLASTHQGPIATIEDEATKRFKTVESYYEVELTLSDNISPLRFGQTGEVRISGIWKSRMMSFWDAIVRIFWKETSL